MTRNRWFFILLFASIGYSLLMIPASFLALYSPFVTKGEIGGTLVEWINYISIISFPAIALTGIFAAWSSYHQDQLRLSLFWICVPLCNLLLYGLTALF